MAFTRQFLTSNGVPEDKVDAIMAERNRTLNDYVLKTDVQAQIDAALAAQKPPEVDAKTLPEYQALERENSKLKAFQGDDFAAVKAPYRDMVWERLDHGEKHKEYKEQLTEMAKTMPDIFVAEDEPTKAPTFGAQTHGSAPTGKLGPSFMDTWGFVPQKPE